MAGNLLVDADEYRVSARRIGQDAYDIVAAGETFRATADVIGNRLSVS